MNKIYEIKNCFKMNSLLRCRTGGFTGMVVILLTLILTFGSCKKYLDVKTTNIFQFIKTADDCQKLLDDYNNMNLGFPSDGQASTDEYYLSEINYNQLTNPEDKGIYSWNPTAVRNAANPQWQTTYHIVYLANLIKENAEKLKGKESDAVLDPIRGQALFFRAYAHWNVAQLYCKPYTSATAGTDPGIPIRLSSDISDKSSRGTVQDTYNQIIADLTEAAGLITAPGPTPMPVTTWPASRPSKMAAYAMLARVYLSMGDYTNAQTNATAALALKTANIDLIDYNNVSTTSAPFARFNQEVIFHSVITPNVPNGITLLNPGGETNPFARINSDLYASYDANDLRKSIFFKQNRTPVNIPDPTQPGGVRNNVQVYDGTYRFSGNYEPSGGADLFNGLAVDELYLIRAECYARAGNAALAIADLNTLLVTRWKTGAYVPIVASTADAALTTVLTERRKELVMRGQRWTDARRLQLSLTRQTKQISGIATGVYSPTNNPVTYTVTFTYTPTATYTLPANDPRFTLLIPREVIDNAGGAIPQNAR